MGEKTLAFRIGKHHFEARAIFEAHEEKYPVFWTGLRGAVDYALLTGSLHTRYGWHVHVDRNTNPRSLQNYLMQANGAEMMRIAACLATEQGLSICPIHDAFLLTAPTEHIERDIAILQECMAEAAAVRELATSLMPFLRQPKKHECKSRCIPYLGVVNCLRVIDRLQNVFLRIRHYPFSRHLLSIRARHTTRFVKHLAGLL
jgi:hypothetical protein